ncbi:MAG: hypothetical protein Q4A36_03755 [Candidatus Saccharibacteria bacterium]|nr:hypothetical protein [Candidatus Saccharibacteria bacterium]
MDATFLARLKSDYPKLHFRSGKKFAFRPPKTIIFPVGDGGNSDSLLILHEMGHALSHHRVFKTEIGRLKMEVEAWEKARELAYIYKIPIDEELIEGELDTYRDWLHQKSRCPNCGLTRFQTPDGVFKCPKCDI